jgi:hypothetical protein
LPASLSSRSLTAVLALALSTVAIVALLVLSPLALAHGHKAACSSAATHSKHGARACTQSKRAASSHKRKSDARPKAKPKAKPKGHHAKHAVTTKKTVKTKAKSPAGTIQTPAVCEDGSVPVQESNGFFACDDESEPGCENGATPMLSPNGKKLICGPAAKGASVAREAACEDGSTPSQGSDGSFSCDDESEPTCENGSEPTLSSNGSTLVCDVSTTEKNAG